MDTLLILAAILLRIEVNAARYPEEQVAVSDSIILGSISRSGEHRKIVAETVGIFSIDSGLALLLKVVIGVTSIRAGLGNIH